MNQNLLKSIIFHLVIAILLVISTWSIFSRKEVVVDETPIVVSLAPIGEKTNVKPAPNHEVKPPKPPAAKKPVPKPPEKKPEPKKPEPKPEPKKPDVKPKPPEKKPEKEKPKKDDLDKMLDKLDKDQPDKLDTLLKDLDKTKTPDKSSKEADTKDDSKSDQKFDPNSPEAVAEKDVIVKLVTDQIKRCWSPPAGAMNAKDMAIIVDVDIQLDGTMKFAGFPKGEGNDPVALAASDSARRAILDPDCNPLKELPPADKYNDIWKEMRLTFNPKDMLGN